MYPLIQSSHDLFYREGAYISQHRPVLAAVTDKPQMVLASSNVCFCPCCMPIAVSRRLDCARFMSSFRSRAEGAVPNGH